jgi:hypothetical protein
VSYSGVILNEGKDFEVDRVHSRWEGLCLGNDIKQIARLPPDSILVWSALLLLCKESNRSKEDPRNRRWVFGITPATGPGRRYVFSAPGPKGDVPKSRRD